MRNERVRAPRFVAGLFVAIHALAFGMVLARVPLLPHSAYEDPTPSVIRFPNGGLQFNICHDCGPGFLLAGRGFGWGMPGNDRFTGRVMLLNLPGQIGAELVGSIVEDALGQYGKMWLATCVFVILSTGQWWVLGWILGCRVCRHASSGRLSSERS